MKRILLVFVFSSTILLSSGDQDNARLLSTCKTDTSKFDHSYSQDQLFLSIKNNLLTSPLEALKKAEELDSRAQHIFNASLRNDNPENRAHSLGCAIAELESICPIFLLRECNSLCYLNRKNNPNTRTTFENKVATAYINEIGTDNKPISYDSFGSGDGFQDLVILTKILDAKPHAKITINFIDTNYHRSKDQYAVFEEGEDVCWARDAKFEAMSKQLLSFFKTTFPQSELTLTLSASYEDYLDQLLAQLSCPSKKCLIPVLIHAIDIEEKDALIDYQSLFFNLVDHNPSVRGILCARANNKQGFFVLTRKNKKTPENSNASYDETVSECFEEIM